MFTDGFGCVRSAEKMDAILTTLCKKCINSSAFCC